MATNLLEDRWKDVDPHELRLLLHERIGGPGQYEGQLENPNTIHVPLAGSSCKVSIEFQGSEISAIEPGPLFDPTEWKGIIDEINSLLDGPTKVGRDYSFSAYKVQGSWRGDRSGVQILPSRPGTPSVPAEIGEHPFILEFPIRTSNLWPITNYRRLRELGRLSLLLNILLVGRISLQSRRPDHVWAIVEGNSHEPQAKWVQLGFLATLGDAVNGSLSEAAEDSLEQIEPEEYYNETGHDGGGLRVPSDLDESICLYNGLSRANRDKFDRAAFWMDMASRTWAMGVSLSFACLVSAIESLTAGSTTHRVFCPDCNNYTQHQVPGAGRRFREFFERFAPGVVMESRRNKMYSLRSGITHGSKLMQIDQDLAFGWDPPSWNEHELHDELWSVARIALRNWLKHPQWLEVSHEEIARTAYFLWEKRGRPEGSPDVDWFQGERAIRERFRN